MRRGNRTVLSEFIVNMEKVLFWKIFCSLFILSTGLKYVPFDLPFEDFIGDRLHEIRNDWQYAKEVITKMLAEKEIPISQPPFFAKRAENKTFDLLTLLDYGESFDDIEPQIGTNFQNLSQLYGYYDISEVLFVLREFFFNLTEILLYRGVHSLDDVLEEYDNQLKPLQPEDIVKLPIKNKHPHVWFANLSQKEINLYGITGENMIYPQLLDKETVAIKKKHTQIYNFVVKIVWHLFHLYYKEYAKNESLVHQHLKKEQITGHFLGNTFSINYLTDLGPFENGIRNNYMKNIDKDKLKNEIQGFVNELDALLTGNDEPELLSQKSWVKKNVIELVWDKSKLKDLYDFKKEKLEKLLSMKNETEISNDNVLKIMELFTSNWKVFFYLHVSGTIESTKPPPEFYNHHETVEEASNMSDFSDRIEMLLALTKRSTKEIKNVSPVTAFGVELGGMLAKSLDRKDPFRNIVQKVFRLVQPLIGSIGTIKKKMNETLTNLCQMMLPAEDECVFIEKTFKRINIYVQKDGLIAGEKYCEAKTSCKEVDYSSYFLYIRKMTELQAASMSILEFILLQSERKKMLKTLHSDKKKNLKGDMEELFERSRLLPIFLTEEYRKILIDYIEGSKNSNVMKLIKMKIERERKKEPVAGEKLYGPDLSKLDDSTLDGN